MNWRYPGPFNFLILVFLCTATVAFSQPQLPDIACSISNNMVFLSWKCQYDGVKGISVFRSADSLQNYSMIGVVKNLKKGIQNFEDENPLSGKNYYKLTITFKSGLNWNTNYCRAIIGQGRTPVSAPAPTASSAPSRMDSPVKRVGAGMTPPPARPIITESNAVAAEKKRNDTPNKQNCNVSLTFIPDSATGRLQLPKRKPLISTDDPALRQPDLIKSQYIFSDNGTGHIKMELPEDIIGSHYSVRFYDAQNNAVVDVPRVNTAKLMLDKRNFRKRGSYKFILKKDGLELERGWVNVN